MRLLEDRDGFFSVGGPGSTTHFLIVVFAALVSLACIIVPLHDGSASWASVPPALFWMAATGLGLILFDSRYRFDPRRREVTRRFLLFGMGTWTRKLADFANIRGHYLSEPLSNGSRTIFLEVLLNSGQVLEVRLSSEPAALIENSVQAFYKKYQIQPADKPDRKIWESRDENTGCLVSLFGCATPCALSVLMAMLNSYAPPIFLLGLLLLIFLGPFSYSGWRAVPEEDRLERFFGIGPWRLARSQSLQGRRPEIQRLLPENGRPFGLCLSGGLLLDRYPSEEQAIAELERFRRLLP